MKMVGGNANQNPNMNGNLVATRDEGNATGHNENQIRCYNCKGVGHFARNCTVRPRRKDVAYLQTQLLIAQKEEARIQLQAEEFDLMAAVADLDDIEEVNANCILMANLQQVLTSGTQTDKAPIYDSDGSAEVHNYENFYDNEIFNMFPQEEQYTELLEPIPEPHQVPQNDNNVNSEVSSVEQSGGIVEQHPANVEETRDGGEGSCGLLWWFRRWRQWCCGGNGSEMKVASAVGVAARGGEWCGGSNRSRGGECFWGSPEKFSGDGGGGRLVARKWSGVEESCVTCGGAHSYRNCPATDGNIYRDNIQEYVSQAFAVNYNQGNTSYRPQMMSNQIRPPGFPPMPNNQNVQRNNQNRFIPNQNRGNNFNQGLVYQPPVFQQPAYQAPAYQAPAPQTQGVSKEDFSAYVKANDAFVNSNSASTSSSGTLPSNMIANQKSDLKAITTRSGVSYDGPQIPPPVVENKPEATKDTVNPTNNENTKDVQPQAVQSESPVSTEPTITPVSASKPNPKASILYPSRRNDERNREKANNQIEKFYQIFKEMSFEISFADALILMPKFASTLKALIGNKEKLSEMARTPLNEHCSTVLLKKLPEKLGDPGKFLIPCDFPSMAECLALADLGASINLIPFSVWKRLSLPDLTPTCMTLKLADRSISCPVRVAEDVYVKVGSFYFLADFVVVDFDADPRVPLILGRSFLKTGRSLIDVFEGPVYQPPVFQPPAYQAPAYQAPAPQTQGISKEDFSAYIKANDAVMRNMQTQGQNMQNHLTNLTELITKFVNSNSASTSSSGTLPSNIIANPRSDLKSITPRSGVSYDGHQIPPPPSFLPKVVENKPEATKDTVNPTNNESTEDVQPQIV
nr:reverse transcriptase domain-containing protein [Tanacetum cinerariifolium]